jgi:hypothetical protein
MYRLRLRGGVKKSSCAGRHAAPRLSFNKSKQMIRRKVGFRTRAQTTLAAGLLEFKVAFVLLGIALGIL